MLTIYRLVLYLFTPVVFFRLLLRALKSGSYFRNIPQRFGFFLQKEFSRTNIGDGIWIHAVSVGEVNASVPLVKALMEKYPDATITITTMTPTGSERVRRNFSNTVEHCYLPYDYSGAMKRFFNLVQPGLVMVMETEIWPNLIHECKKRKIPLIYTNVRLSAKSHKSYARFRLLFNQVLKNVPQFAVQSQSDADRLIDIGAHIGSIEVTGSVKFEMTIPPSVLEAAQSVRRDLGWERPVWVAGSTHEGEESQIIDTFLKAQKKIPNLLLVLVPRHPERFGTVFRLCNRYECKTIKRSQTQGEIPADTEIYLGDTMGDLALLIAAGDFAYIGGSLVPMGGHNLLEACAVGVSVIFGPHMFNFQEISELVLSKGAGIQVLNSDELYDVIKKLCNDPVLRDQYGSAGKEFIEENRGALNKIMSLVEKYYTI